MTTPTVRWNLASQFTKEETIQTDADMDILNIVCYTDNSLVWNKAASQFTPLLQ